MKKIILLILVLVTINMVQGLPSDELTGHWNFNDGFNDSINNNDGIGNGGVTTNSSDCPNSTKYGSCVDFDGIDDFVNISYVDSYYSGGTWNDYCLGMWIKLKNNTDNNNTIFGNRENFDIQILEDGDINYSIWSRYPSSPVLWGSATTDNNQPLNDGNWHYFMVGREGSWGVQVYVDGVSEKTGGYNPTGAGDLGHGGDFYIGKGNQHYGYTNATIDEISYWTKKCSEVGWDNIWNNGNVLRFENGFLQQDGNNIPELIEDIILLDSFPTGFEKNEIYSLSKYGSYYGGMTTNTTDGSSPTDFWIAAYDNKVYRYNSTGTRIDYWDTIGSSKGIDYDPFSDTLWVVGWEATETLQEYYINGTLKQSFNTSSWITSVTVLDEEYLIIKDNDYVRKVNKTDGSTISNYFSVSTLATNCGGFDVRGEIKYNNGKLFVNEYSVVINQDNEICVLNLTNGNFIEFMNTSEKTSGVTFNIMPDEEFTSFWSILGVSNSYPNLTRYDLEYSSDPIESDFNKNEVYTLRYGSYYGGITTNTTDGSSPTDFWMTAYDNKVYRFNSTGIQTDYWNIIGTAKGIDYDPSRDTLWINGWENYDTLQEYYLNGTLKQSFNTSSWITGVTVLDEEYVIIKDNDYVRKVNKTDGSIISNYFSVSTMATNCGGFDIRGEIEYNKGKLYINEYLAVGSQDNEICVLNLTNGNFIEFINTSEKTSGVTFNIMPDEEFTSFWSVLGVSNSYPNLTRYDFESSSDALQNITLYANCEDADEYDVSSLSGYYKVYKDDNQYASGSSILENGTLGGIYTLNSSEITSGEQWKFETWCEDNWTRSSSDTIILNILNKVPEINNVSLSQAIDVSVDCSDDDGDLDFEFRFNSENELIGYLSQPIIGFTTNTTDGSTPTDYWRYDRSNVLIEHFNSTFHRVNNFTTCNGWDWYKKGMDFNHYNNTLMIWCYNNSNGATGLEEYYLNGTLAGQYIVSNKFTIGLAIVKPDELLTTDNGKLYSLNITTGNFSELATVGQGGVCGNSGGYFQVDATDEEIIMYYEDNRADYPPCILNATDYSVIETIYFSEGDSQAASNVVSTNVISGKIKNLYLNTGQTDYDSFLDYEFRSDGIAYVQMYYNGSINGSVQTAPRRPIHNELTDVYTHTNSSGIWISEAWCNDGNDNSTKMNGTVTI